MRVLRGHKKALYSLALLPGGAVVAGGIEGVVSVWDSAGVRRIVAEDQGQVGCVAASPDGEWLAWWGLGPDASVARAAGGSVVARLPAREGAWYSLDPTSCAFAPDGQTLATVGDGGLRRWRVGDWELVPPAPGGESLLWSGLAFAPDSLTAVAETRRGGIELWDARTGQTRPAFPPGHPFAGAGYSRLAWSPDGELLAGQRSEHMSNELHVWNAATGGVVFRSPPANQHTHALAWSPDGRRVATGGTDGLVTLRDTATWQVVTQYDWKLGAVRDVAYSTDGLMMAACGSRGKVVVWDAD